jgi:hypothetical protein
MMQATCKTIAAQNKQTLLEGVLASALLTSINPISTTFLSTLLLQLAPRRVKTKTAGRGRV